MENYNFLVPVGPNDIEIGINVVSQLLEVYSTSSVFVISEKKNFYKFDTLNRLFFLDEDEIFPGLTLDVIKAYFKNRNADINRSGWYFQQFLKISFSLKFHGESYIIWDSDTLPLKEIPFQKSNKVFLYYYKKQEHFPYIETNSKIFGDWIYFSNRSFITEKMFVVSKYMKEMVIEIENNHSKPFYFAILDKIDNQNINGSGFSEFFCYAHFLINNYKDTIVLQKAKNHYRFGNRIFLNFSLKKEEINYVSRHFSSISFEAWDQYVEPGRLLNFIKQHHLTSFKTYLFIHKIFIKLRLNKFI